MSWANVWCSRCGENGHYARECYKEPQRRVHYVDPEDEVYYTILEEHGEKDAYGRGRGTPQQIIANPDSRTTRPGPNQGMNPQTRFVTRQLGYCFICRSPHHYACPFNGQGQGAPLLLPCQNCGEYGHEQTRCPKPQQT